MMDLTVTLLLLLLGCSSIFAHIRVDAPEVHFISAENTPTFLRYAVESMPKDETQGISSRITMRPTFGEIFLPLRSAVESVPSINVRNAEKLRDSASASLRTFVRDSVEAFPNDEWDFEVDDKEEESIRLEEQSLATKDATVGEIEFMEPDDWIVSDKYSAFLEPSNKADVRPQPYRAGSPYQQLVEADEYDTLDQIEAVEITSPKYSSYGALAVRDSENLTNYQPYGALAQIKQATQSKNTNSEKQVLCYITNWAFYRQADSKFVPEQLDRKLCTTLIYSFASLDPDHLVIKEFDPWVDVENAYYKRAVESGIPVLIAMGGWTDSTGDKYSRLVSDDIKRRIFASNVATFIQKNGFSGLHFDWNYPVCWQSDCTKGPNADKPNLTKLLSEVRREFNRLNHKLKLGLAVSGYKEIITKAYDFPELSNIVDYLTVMSYDYHGAWEGQTGHVSPLFGKKGDKYPQYNTDYALQLVLKLGAHKDKIIMGIPLYGQSFTLERESSQLVGEGITSVGPGEPGEFTKQPGMLAYYEICQRIRKQKWLTSSESSQKSGPYAMWRNQWIGYENPSSVAVKARYAVNNGFAGIAAWTVDLDDFQNRCCTESFPLLKSINRALGRLKTPAPTRVNCERPLAPVTPSPPEVTTISSDGSGFSSSVPSNVQNEPTSPSATQSPTSSTVWWTPTTSTTSRPTTMKPTQTTSTPIHHTTIPSPEFYLV